MSDKYLLCKACKKYAPVNKMHVTKYHRKTGELVIKYYYCKQCMLKKSGFQKGKIYEVDSYKVRKDGKTVKKMPATKLCFLLKCTADKLDHEVELINNKKSENDSITFAKKNNYKVKVKLGSGIPLLLKEKRCIKRKRSHAKRVLNNIYKKFSIEESANAHLQNNHDITHLSKDLEHLTDLIKNSL